MTDVSGWYKDGIRKGVLRIDGLPSDEFILWRDTVCSGKVKIKINPAARTTCIKPSGTENQDDYVLYKLTFDDVGLIQFYWK